MNTNGDLEQMDTVEASDVKQQLVECGLQAGVADGLESIIQMGKLQFEELDERAIDALKEFPLDGAQQVLQQFAESNLDHVTNKSAFLCGVMKTYRQREKLKDQPGANPTPGKGPDEARLKEILDRTGYSLDVTTGQRKYGGPPPDWNEPQQPGSGCEVFCGKIPKDVFEDELIPLFEVCGRIWDLRLMMDPITASNRGYAFITFCDKEGAQEAVKQLDGYEIQKGKLLKVNVSVANTRLFVGNIPKNKSKDEIYTEFIKICGGITEVIIYCAPDDKKKNRGFCFLDFDSHKSASAAKKRLSNSRTRVWNCDIIVDWADAQEEPDNETMAKVKVLYVRNLTQEVSEEKLKEVFQPYGAIERVKKIKDYGFVHFENREDAMRGLEEMNGQEVCGSNWQVSLAKPPVDKKKKEQLKRDQERRLMSQLQQRGYYDPHGHGQGGGRGGRGYPGGGAAAMGGGGGMGAAEYDYYGGAGGYGDYGYMDPYYGEYYGYGDYEGSYGYDGFGGGMAMAPARSMRGRGMGAAGPMGAVGGGRGGGGMMGMGGGPMRRGAGRAGMAMRGGPMRGAAAAARGGAGQIFAV